MTRERFTDKFAGSLENIEIQLVHLSRGELNENEEDQLHQIIETVKDKMYLYYLKK